MKIETRENSFHIKNQLNGLSSDNLKSAFPYKVYLDSINIYNISEIKESILEIDAITKDNMLSQQIVSIALTDSLLNYSENKYEKYNPDSLILLMEWVERFKYYADVDEENQTLYQVVDDYWMNSIANKLSDFCKKDYWIKYDYKFKYLSSRMEEKGFNTTIGFNDAEKVLNNIIENDYTYLINRFLTRTSFLIKVIFLLGIIITLYGYYCIFKSLKKS